MRENPNFILRCLKITEKVSLDIASEASYIYILSGQKFIKNAKNGPFWRVFEKPEVCGQTVFRMRHFESQFSIFSHDSCSFGIEKKAGQKLLTNIVFLAAS